MKGFDYRSQESFDRRAGELRADLLGIIGAGGAWYVRDGETFARDASGRLLWEAYGHIANKPTKVGDAALSYVCKQCGQRIDDGKPCGCGARR